MSTTTSTESRHTPTETPATSHSPEAQPTTPDAAAGTPAPAVPLLVLSRVQAAQALGISTRLLDDLIRSHDLPSLKLGGRVVVVVALLEEYLRNECEKNGKRK